METLLSYNFDNIILSKPKKYTEYLVSKVKYKNEENIEDLIVQFPKMLLSEDPSQKSIELEFVNTKGYNKEIYNFLRKLDSFIVNKVHTSSEEWFEKVIPIDSIKKMYNSFIKAPKTSESKCTLNFGIKIHKNEIKSIFIDKKCNEIDFSQFNKNEIVECIAQFKYIFFSKDTCFAAWELISAKLHKKTQKVPKFGFIDDPDDIQKCESDDDDDGEIFTNFF
jgi:hypothetical protein